MSLMTTQRETTTNTLNTAHLIALRDIYLSFGLTTYQAVLSAEADIDQAIEEADESWSP